MITIAEKILYDYINGVISYIREDYKKYDDKKRTFLYYLLNGAIFTEDSELYPQAINLFLREGNDANERAIESRMIFDASRATLPTIHINLPSEQADIDGIGIDTGYQPNFDEENYNESQETHTRSFNSVFNMIITSDNLNEVLIIYHALKAILTATLDLLEFKGLRNIKLGGRDMQMDPELIPPGIFFRVLTINCFTEVTVPTTFREDFIKLITIDKSTILDINSEVKLEEKFNN